VQLFGFAIFLEKFFRFKVCLKYLFVECRVRMANVYALAMAGDLKIVSPEPMLNIVTKDEDKSKSGFIFVSRN
jgi:hypothetical protein